MKITNQKPKTKGKKKAKTVRRPKAPVRLINERLASLTVSPRPREMKQNINAEHVCALTDPFCKHAEGVKYPDSSSARTLAYGAHFRGLMGTDATGNAANLFCPAFDLGTAVGTISGGQANYTTMVANTTSGLVPIGYRIVLMGIRIRNMTAPLNASGMVYIRGFPAQNGSTLTAIPLQSYNCDFFADIPLQSINTNGHTDIVFKRTDHMASVQFVSPNETNPNANVSSYIAPGWGTVQVGVFGGPISTTVLDVEYFIHYELMFDDSTAIALLATPAPHTNPMLSTLAANVSRAAGNVFYQIGNDATKAITALARKAMSGAGKALVMQAAMLL